MGMWSPRRYWAGMCCAYRPMSLHTRVHTHTHTYPSQERKRPGLGTRISLSKVRDLRQARLSDAIRWVGMDQV